MGTIGEDYMQANFELYKKIIDKAVNGEPITDNDLIFISMYRKDLRKAMAQPPLQRVIKGIKQVQQMVREFSNEEQTTENDEDYEVEEEEITDGNERNEYGV